MTSFHAKPKYRTVLRAILTVAVLFMAYRWFDAFKLQQQARSLNSHEAKKVDLSSSENPIDFNSISNRLIVESIVAIIQNYYVDHHRSSGEQLVESALKGLTEEYPEIDMTHDQKEVVISGGGIEITSFKINPLKYEHLVDAVIDISRYLERNHFDDVAQDPYDDEPRLSPGYFKVLDSLLRGLDAHSMFLNVAEYEELRQGTEGQFGGLGILVGIRNNMLTVIKPLPDSPAMRVGLKKEDKIIKINGVETFGFSLDELVEHMRGEPGSSVQISVLRNGYGAPLNYKLSRQKINVDSVNSELISNDGKKTGKITIESFSSRTGFEVETALKKLKRKAGSDFAGLILDMRSNPGGLLDQAVAVADLFLDKGVIVSTRGRREEVEVAGNDSIENDFPIAVLLNSDTASASEIVAGALQDHNRAIVIGQPTFGKGTVQTIFELPGGQALKLTVARYYTPADRSIQAVGIVPDIWLQPIYRAEENSDLMGGYHYRSEKFLSNHLEHQSENNLSMSSTMPSLFKGYYLSEKTKPDQFEVNPSSDVEQKMALEILSGVSKHFGDKLPKHARRAQHWLGVSSMAAIKKVKQFDSEAVQWLKKRFGISWDPGAIDYSNQLSMKLDWGSVNYVRSGEKARVNYRIENESQHDVERVSLFVWAKEGVTYNEKLVGKVHAGRSAKGFIEFKVPFGVELDKLHFHSGIAVDALPAVTSSQSHRVFVQSSAKPKFELKLSFDDQKSNNNGVIDPDESGTLSLDLSNADDRNYQNIEVRMINLSGNQISFDQKELIHLTNIDANSKQTLEFKIRSGSKIAGSRCFVGVEVLDKRDGSQLYSRGLSVESKSNFFQNLSPKNAALIGH